MALHLRQQQGGGALGRSRDELLGKNIWEEFPQAEGSVSDRQIEWAMEEGIATEFEAESPVLGAWVAARAYPSRGGLSVHFATLPSASSRGSPRRAREAERKRIARDRHDAPCKTSPTPLRPSA